MDKLRIEKSIKTPMVEFNTNGELKIEGRSIPENTVEFYTIPLNWLKTFANNRPSDINLHITLDFFNTSSSKLLLDIFKLLEQMQKQRTIVNVYWHYSEDNENMQEAGEDYKGILKLPFHLVKS